MNLIALIFHNLASFIFIISTIVFVHEFGHFIVARLCGVRVEQFSIGFGKKICGLIDKKGTEWKICLLPFGGYVKMYGDSNGASVPDFELIKKMSAAEQKISFLGKNVYQRMAIVAAGPAINFILGILIFTGMFWQNGISRVEPVVSELVKNSPAEKSGILVGDRIILINSKPIKDFYEIREILQNSSGALDFEIDRNGKIIKLAIEPKIEEQKAIFDEKIKIKMVGIMANKVSQEKLNFFKSFIQANKETYHISAAILKTLWQLISGQRSVRELGGPVKIAKYSGKSVDAGIYMLAWFMAMISINLGVMNLLPVPMLDGGHLLFYAIEAIRKKPLSNKVQKIGFQIGLSLIVALMLTTTFNDIASLFGSN